MFTELRRRMDEHSENFNEEIENIKKYQTEVITQLKNTLEGSSSRLDEVEEWVSELKDKIMKHPYNCIKNNIISRQKFDQGV